MSLYSTSIRRPVLAIVMALVITIFGLIAFSFLGVREFPNVDSPVVSVATNYTGANADVIESQITEPLEEEVNSVPGIRSLTSTSREGRSTLRVEFEVDVDLETAANDVRDRVSRAVRQLPPDADPPSVSKNDADGSPIVFLNIRSEQRSLLELTTIAENDFKERLQTIAGVSQVDIWGSKRPAMRLWLDPKKLAAYGLTAVEVRSALQRENVELPAGRIEGDAVELTVRTLSRLSSVDDFNQLVLKEDGGRVVRLEDVGRAELGPENLRTVLKRDGIPMVGVVLRPQAGANEVEIVDEFFRRVEQIEKDLPEDITLGLGFDTSQYIRQSVSEVQQTIFVAFTLVVLIIFLFLRDLRTTIIPVVVMPVSLIGVFFVLYLAGFSINVLTLLGVVLAIGLVVDDAIVVLENIYAKIEGGMRPVQAGLEGTREIFFAVVATTVVLVSVFLPILFLGGQTGRLFREFGVTIAGAVIISSFVALTLTPMLSTRLLHRKQGHSWFYHRTEPFFVRLTDGYRSLLRGFLRHRWLAIPVLLATIGGIWFFLQQLPRELAPLEDRGGVRLNIVAQEGASFEYMDRYMNDLVAHVQEQVPEIQALISVTSPGFGSSSSVNTGFLRLRLSPPEERERSQDDIAKALSASVKQLSGARVSVSQEQSIGGRRRGQPIEYVIQAPNFERLREVLPEFLRAANQDPRLDGASSDLKFNKPELRVEIDRERARDLGVSARDIAQTLATGLTGQRFGFFILDGKQYQVIGQLTREYRNEPLDLRSLYVRASDGRLVQLDNLVRVEETVSPPQLYRFNRYVSATISSGLAAGATIDDGIQAMDEIADQVLDDSFSTSLDGTSRDFVESASGLGFVFWLALLLVYLVLCAQFESFRDPLVIMFTVPLALCGGLAALWFFGESLNVFSQIGLIMLLGLVTKNGILIVEFANQRKTSPDSEQQGDPLAAVEHAAVARFRPVLMTSLSTILGILPLALALGAGSESRVSMGVAVIGGLVLGSVLTLFVIPALYSYLTSRQLDRIRQEADELMRADAATRRRAA